MITDVVADVVADIVADLILLVVGAVFFGVAFWADMYDVANCYKTTNTLRRFEIHSNFGFLGFNLPEYEFLVFFSGFSSYLSSVIY